MSKRRLSLWASLITSLVACDTAQSDLEIEAIDGATYSDDVKTSLDVTVGRDIDVLDSSVTSDFIIESDVNSLDSSVTLDSVIESDIGIDAQIDTQSDTLDLGADITAIGYIPDYHQVAVTKVERITHVSWIGESGSVFTRQLGEVGEWDGPSRILNDGPADQVSAHTVNGVPWVSWSFEGGKVRLTRSDTPDSSVYNLNINGPALLSNSDDQNLLVMGMNDDNRLSWQKLDSSIPLEAQSGPIIDYTGLPKPDSLVGIRHGSLMRFSSSGQCIQLNTDALPVGNLPCKIANGMLISDGTMPILVHSLFTEGVERVSVSSIFNESTPFLVVTVENQQALRFQGDNSSRVIVGRGAHSDENLIQMVFIEADELSYSEAAPNWEYQNSRATSKHGNKAYLFSFGTENDPILEILDLMPIEFENETYGFTPLICIAPAAERCDEFDHDCDGSLMNGCCCFNEDVGLTDEIQLQDSLSQIILTEHSNTTRVLGTKFGNSWTAWELRVPNPNSPRLPPIKLGTCVEGEGLGCVANHRCEVMEDEYHCVNFNSGDSYRLNPFEINEISRVYNFTGVGNGAFFATIGEDMSNEPSLWWQYYRHGRINRKEPLGCSQTLASDKLDFTELSEASVLIVCKDKIKRMFVDPDIVDVEYDFSDLGHGEIEWATITRPTSTSRHVLVGYFGLDGIFKVSQYTFIAINTQLLQQPISTELAAVNPDDLIHPIYLHPVVLGPPVQIVADRVRVLETREDNQETIWLDVITHENANRIIYNTSSEEIIAAAPLENGGFDFWALKVSSRRENLNLWSVQPTLSINEGTMWTSSTGEHLDPIMVLTPGENNRWRINTYGFNCR